MIFSNIFFSKRIYSNLNTNNYQLNIMYGGRFLINKRLMMLAILLAGLLAVSAVGAADNATGDIADTEITADEAVVIEENQEILSEDDDYGTFSDLANLINDADINLTLAKNYRFTDTDSKYVNGIEIRKGINIFGNGATIDGSNQARIFNVFRYSSFHDMNFLWAAEMIALLFITPISPTIMQIH